MSDESNKNEEIQASVFFITGDGEIISSDSVVEKMQDSAINRPIKKLIADSFTESVKSITGSTQSLEEIKANSVLTTQPIEVNGINEVVEPPYPVEVLQKFLELEETHARCVRVKASDSVCRGYRLKNSVPILLQNKNSDNSEDQALNAEETVERSIYLKDLRDVQKFIRDCNEIVHFEGVLELAALDYEAFGWCAIEVIRSVDKKVKKLAHVPAYRVKPMFGFEGFIEYNDSNLSEPYKYYLPFGKKLVQVEEDSLTGLKQVTPFDPDTTSIDDPSVQFNLINSQTGEPTDNFLESANEIIWLKNHHPNTLYYGYCDAIPAVGAIIGNANIRNYFLQFFDHNTVPRFAVVVEGGRLSEEVMKFIHKYFDSEVKKTAHSTLILNVPSMRGEVKVRFEKLDTDQKEGDFLKTSDSNRQAIMTAHGVSGAIIGVSEAPELGSGKGLSQAEIYKDRIVVPRQRKWELAINDLFRRGLGTRFVKIEFNPLDIRDREAEMRILTGYMDRGAMAINDAREAIGMQPIEGGNRAFVKSRSGQLVFVDGFDTAGPVTPTDPVAEGADSPENEESSNQNSESVQSDDSTESSADDIGQLA
jgi:capsid portal protein